MGYQAAIVNITGNSDKNVSSVFEWMLLTIPAPPLYKIHHGFFLTFSR